MDKEITDMKNDVEVLNNKIDNGQKRNRHIETIVEQADQRNQTTSFRRKIPLEYWNCGEKGHIRPRCPKLGSEQAPVQRQVEDKIWLDSTKPHFQNNSKIPDDVLMGLELMKKDNFQLNLQERSIKTGQDEIIISMPRSDAKVKRITLTEDVILPAWSETIVMVNLEPVEDDGQVELIEPDLDEDIVKKGLLVATTLSQRKNNTVHVRLVNLKNCDQKLKNGDILGKSQIVTCITKCEDIEEEPSYCDSEEIPEKFEALTR
ncbi:hypothetical protein NQ317_002606 [Molorchus minor]|uniref:CCHC-type domain-containing protein n=1 Tax=Molorchus minor TaxID=1323400 RepID=A0ABQ9JW51_9CUCU|nr:hypothetical protein NQ317_002606 [Molorchus minor]